MIAAVAALVFAPFSFERVDRLRWDLTRLARSSFILFIPTILAALIWLPLVWPALLLSVVCLASFGFAGMCLLEVERREAR